MSWIKTFQRKKNQTRYNVNISTIISFRRVIITELFTCVCRCTCIYIHVFQSVQFRIWCLFVGNHHHHYISFVYTHNAQFNSNLDSLIDIILSFKFKRQKQTTIFNFCKKSFFKFMMFTFFAVFQFSSVSTIDDSPLTFSSVLAFTCLLAKVNFDPNNSDKFSRLFIWRVFLTISDVIRPDEAAWPPWWPVTAQESGAPFIHGLGGAPPWATSCSNFSSSPQSEKRL